MPGIQLTPQQEEILVGAMFTTDKGMWLGPYLMGTVLDMYFAGYITSLFITWIRSSKDDSKFIKTCVYSGTISCFVLSIFNIVFEMRCFVFGFGKYANFAQIQWLQGLVVCGMVVYVAAQSFYAQRGYRVLGRSKIFLVIVGLLMGMEFTAEAAVLIVAKVWKTNLLENYKLRPILFCVFVGQLGADVIITGSTAYGLWKSKTGWKHTDRLIKKLVLFTLETQSAPTIVALVFLIYFVYNPDTSFSIFFTLVLNKIYVIGMLMLLNARGSIRKDIQAFPKSENTFQMQNAVRMKKDENQTTSWVPYGKQQTTSWIPYTSASSGTAFSEGLEADSFVLKSVSQIALPEAPSTAHVGTEKGQLKRGTPE